MTDENTEEEEQVAKESCEKCDEYLSGWKRALADYENLQRNNAQLREDDKRHIRMNIAHELLPVVDNFDQAMKCAPTEIPDALKSWFVGVEHIARQFADVLATLNIAPIDAIGMQFDPHLHESGGSSWDETQAESIVLEEIIKGWRQGDIVIRPSKVIVNQK